jgi:hypothetical protein
MPLPTHLLLNANYVVHQTLKLIQERVGNILELVGIGKNFLNETPAAQQLRDSIDKWDLKKLKSF